MNTAAQRNGVRRMQFGIFEADLEAGELRRSGVRVHLQSQPFKLLEALLEHPGEVVSRETLQLELWGADTTVDFDHSLGIAVNKLREALNDSAENPRFVETLPNAATASSLRLKWSIRTPLRELRILLLQRREQVAPSGGGWQDVWLWFACCWACF